MTERYFETSNHLPMTLCMSALKKISNGYILYVVIYKHTHFYMCDCERGKFLFFFRSTKYGHFVPKNCFGLAYIASWPWCEQAQVKVQKLMSCQVSTVHEEPWKESVISNFEQTSSSLFLSTANNTLLLTLLVEFIITL